jgi:uncharacterized phage-associated protein
MEDVRDVARWFLSKKNLTHKQLQKLCYYAQAWHCALYGGDPLFVDEIQAWVHGPVVVTLYPLYADYGWNEIPQEDFDASHMADDAIDVMEAVYNTYGDLSGGQLEKLTHSEEPWKQARQGLNPWDSGTQVISCAVMRDYYREKYERAQGE